MPLRQGETVPQMIVRVAREQGLDARGTRIALAIAAQESRFNPQAEGDWSDAKNRMRSIGLFQLNEEGLGSGMGDTRYDPEANANRGIANLKAVLAKHGAESDGRVAYLSQRPADEAGYTNSINAKTAGRDVQWAGTIDSAMRGAAPDAPEAQPQVQAGVPVFPLAGQSLANTPVTTEFGAHGSNAGYAGVPETHRGTDLSAKRGSQVLSPSGGTVTTAHNWDGTKNDPYGNWIEVKGDDGKSYRFAHLQSLNVQQGAKVGGGQTIGTVDSTGNSTGDHLHFEVLDQAHGNAPVNPKEYLSGSQTASGGRTVADTSEASYLVTALEKQKEEARIASEAAKREQGLREAEKRNNDAEIAQKSTIKKPDDATKKRIEELKTRNNDLALIIPAAETKAVEADKLFRAIDVQLATARQQASGKELDPSQRSENEAQAEQARANAAKLEEDVRSSKDPASPDNQQKLAQASMLRKQADNYDSIVKADNALKGGQTASAYGSAKQSEAQAAFIQGTLESTVRTHLAAAGLNDAQSKVMLAKLQPEIRNIVAQTGKIESDADYTRALTKAVNDKLPYEISKYKAEVGLTDAQANDLSAKLPGALALQGTEARLQQAQAEAQRSSGIVNLATAHKTQFDMQMEAWKAQRTQELSKLMANPNVSSDQLSGFLMASATNAAEMVNAFNAQVAKSTAEETARHQKTQEGIEIQNADETMRNNLAGNITNYMNARTNQQNASTSAVGPTLGAARVANTLSALGPLMGQGEDGIRSIAANMGVGDSVLGGVLAGLKEYQGTVQGFKDKMPDVRMADKNVATPNFMSPGVTQGAAAGASAVAGLTPPPAAPHLSIPDSVPADAPVGIAPAAAAASPTPEAAPAPAPEAGNTPPDQMDDTGNNLPQQPPDEEELTGGGGGRGGGGGGGGGYAFKAPKGHGKAKPSRAARAMGAFTAPLGRAA